MTVTNFVFVRFAIWNNCACFHQNTTLTEASGPSEAGGCYYTFSKSGTYFFVLTAIMPCQIWCSAQYNCTFVVLLWSIC